VEVKRLRSKLLIFIIQYKARIAMAKAAFNKKKTLFTSKLDLELRKN
jgi:hypothetical protein